MFFEVLIRLLWFLEQHFAKKIFSIFQYKRGRVGLRQILGLRKIVEDIFFLSKFGLVRVANQFFRGSYTSLMVFRAKFCKKKFFRFFSTKVVLFSTFSKNQLSFI